MTGHDSKIADLKKEKGTAAQAGASSAENEKKSREDRLAEALRANLRRRKAAAKERKADE